MHRCNLCQKNKPLSEFHMRYGGKVRQPYCKPCKRFWNSLRTYVDGKLIAPSMTEVRKALAAQQQGFVPPAQPTLKTAGHRRSATPATRKESAALRTQRHRVQHEQRKLRKMEEREGSSVPGTVYLIAERFETAFPPRDPSKVYIKNFAVKIGHTKKDDRIAGLQTGNPRPLVLLAERPGTKDDERALHAKFIGDNVLHEWFRPTLSVLLEFGLRAQVRGNDHLLVEGVVTST